jgi:hypothetical protein
VGQFAQLDGHIVIERQCGAHFEIIMMFRLSYVKMLAGHSQGLSGFGCRPPDARAGDGAACEERATALRAAAGPDGQHATIRH